MKLILAFLGIWFATLCIVLTFYTEYRYDCSKGSTSCTREKLLMLKK